MTFVLSRMRCLYWMNRWNALKNNVSCSKFQCLVKTCYGGTVLNIQKIWLALRVLEKGLEPKSIAKTFSAEDRRLFDIAKNAELTCWLQTSALRPILRKSLNLDQILRSRRVSTWKPVEGQNSEIQGRKAKARLVVLGYLDPRLTEVARDAPTLTKEGRHTILQLIASQGWSLSSFDIKIAFLRGKADEANPLAMEPPKELRERLQLKEGQVCALIGNAYGRVGAQLLFYRELSQQPKRLQFITHPLEPCIHFLESWKNGVRTLHGVLGTHVDDGICGGDKYFHQHIQSLKEKLPFGTFKQRKFTFTGIQLEQLPDFSIVASQQITFMELSPSKLGSTEEILLNKMFVKVKNPL